MGAAVVAGVVVGAERTALVAWHVPANKDKKRAARVPFLEGAIFFLSPKASGMVCILRHFAPKTSFSRLWCVSLLDQLRLGPCGSLLPRAPEFKDSQGRLVSRFPALYGSRVGVEIQLNEKK